MPIRAILFDLDDTLADNKAALERFMNYFIKTYISNFEFKEIEGIKEYIRKADRNGYRDRSELYLELVHMLSWKEPLGLEQFVQFWNTHFPMFTVPMRNMYKVLQDLKANKFNLGMITNGRIYSQNEKVIA